MKVIVNEECISCGMCIDICPEVFSYDENDKSQAIEGSIPLDFEDRVTEAQSSCPVDAIKTE